MKPFIKAPIIPSKALPSLLIKEYGTISEYKLDWSKLFVYWESLPTPLGRVVWPGTEYSESPGGLISSKESLDTLVNTRYNKSCLVDRLLPILSGFDSWTIEWKAGWKIHVIIDDIEEYLSK